MNDQILEAIKSKINAHGELHLDAIHTKSLLKYLAYILKYVDDQEANFKELAEILKAGVS